MGNVGTGIVGQPLQGSGVGKSPTFAAIGVNSGLTAHGVVISENLGAFASTAAATTGQVLTGVTGADPVWASPATSGTVTSVSVVSANGLAGTVATATTTPTITLSTTITGVLSGNGTAITGSAVTQYDVLVGGATNAISSIGPGSAGQVLQSAGNATNPAYSTATYPATAGTSGNVLTSDGTNWNSTAPAATGFAPNSTVQTFDDFLGASVIPSLTFGDTIVSNIVWDSNGGTSTVIPTNAIDSGHPGLLTNASFATADTGLILAANSSLILGGGSIQLNWVINLAILSTGTNTYTLRCGLGDTVNADEVNGVYVEYSSGENSGDWVYKSASASTRTTVNSTIAVTTGYHNIGITINAAANSVAFTVDGVSLGTAISTHIPTTAIAPFIDFVRSAGTIAARTYFIDLFYLSQTLTTAR